MNPAFLLHSRLLLLLVAGLAACAPAPTPARSPAPEASTVDAIAPVHADVELGSADAAIIAGRPVAMDGVAEGLAWPALSSAVHRGPGAVVVLGVARDVPVETVLRAAWTLRDADLRLQTPDARGETRVIELRPKPDAPPGKGCHLAVFVQPDGHLRVAAPGGPRDIPGPDAALALARALDDDRQECPIRYVAFGADDPRASWGEVFDVVRAVDRNKSAGDARYVLGEAVH